MFNLIKGAKFAKTELLKEGYSIDGDWLTANVSAENIRPAFDRFLQEEGDQLYSFWIEEPSSLKDENIVKEAMEDAASMVESLHMDVYYLDGITADVIRQLLDAFGNILIHDGLAYFGVLSENGDELGKYKCNVLRGYSSGGALERIANVFEGIGIHKNDGLITIWDLTGPELPAVSSRYTEEGKDMPGIIATLEGIGLYKAEIRAE